MNISFGALVAAALLGVVIGAMGLGAMRQKMTPAGDRPSEMSPESAVVDDNGQKPKKPHVEMSDFRWAHVESENYRDYIERLRKIECPEETIRDLVVAELDKLYEAKMKQIPRPAPPPYWQTDLRKYQEKEHDYLAALKELNRERTAVLKELLGIEAGDNLPLANQGYLENQLGFLACEKQERAREILARFKNDTETVLKAAGSFLTPEVQAQLNQIEKARLEALGEMLSSEEIQEYEMRTSPIASDLRCNLTSFNPTQSEFQQIFKERKAFETKNQALEDAGMTVEQQSEARARLQDELAGNIAKLLGPNRFEEYQRASDIGYQGALETVRQYGLSETIAADIYRVKLGMQEQMKAIREDETIDTPARLERIQSLRAQVELELKRRMGQEAYRAYYQHGGYWVRNL